MARLRATGVAPLNRTTKRPIFPRPGFPWSRFPWPRFPWTTLGSLAVLIILWQVSAVAAGSDLWPPPAAVLGRLSEEFASGELTEHLSITLLRVATAFAIAMLVGTAFGMLMGSKTAWNNVLDALLIIGLNIPALVTIVLCYLWLGLTEAAAVVAVALNKIPTVVVTVREGARAVDQDLMEVARAYRLSRLTTLRRVFAPQLYPYLMAAARSGLALIWKIVLVVELLGRSDGVGFQIGTFFQFFDITSILAYTLAFAAVVYVIEALVMQPIDRHIARWHR
ncbi:MAG: ABC transporter permease subunit [Gammaproteobacteria bacterium]|nr:ABC transporter permease subunit [Gammaproteobacteria bacterium]